MLEPPVTVVRQDAALMGRTAAELLALQRLAGERGVPRAGASPNPPRGARLGRVGAAPPGRRRSVAGPFPVASPARSLR
jgi:hypothetical protein